LLCDGVKALYETSVSDWIAATPVGFGIHFGEQPIDFSLYEAI
jgi:hypothetical protein